MPVLIVSDIHGNLEALEAVLKDAHGRYQNIVCLGDLVGYGADPNAIVDWARANTEVTVRGNHDRACVGLDAIEGYNEVMRFEERFKFIIIRAAVVRKVGCD